MLFAYVHLNEREPTLCLVASKPDQFSRPVPIESLPITDCAVCRLGHYETVMTSQDDEGWVRITPVNPSKLYLTPLQLDLPGLEVVRVRVKVREDGGYVTEFQQEKDIERDTWQDWNPNQKFRA